MKRILAIIGLSLAAGLAFGQVPATTSWDLPTNTFVKTEGLLLGPYQSTRVPEAGSLDYSNGAVRIHNGSSWLSLGGGTGLWNTNATGIEYVSGDVTIPTDAYAADWDGNNTVPTKDALFDQDKVQRDVNWRVWNDKTMYYAAGGDTNPVYVATNNFADLMDYIIDREGPGDSRSFVIELASCHQEGDYSYPYFIDDTVTIDYATVIRGHGNSATRIRATAALDGPAFQVGPETGSAIGGITAFHGLRFEGWDATTNASAIAFYNAHEPRVWDCVFNGWGKAGIYFSQQNYCDWGSVSRCWFIISKTGPGILSDEKPAATGPIGQSLRIENNHFGCDEGTGVTVTNGFHSVFIRNNRFLWYSGAEGGGGGYGSPQAGISLDDVHNVQIGNNTFDDWPTTIGYPIRFEDQPAITNTFGTVYNNTAERMSITGLPSPTYMVYVGDNVQGLSLINNKSDDGAGYLLGGTNGPMHIVDDGYFNMPGQSLTGDSVQESGEGFGVRVSGDVVIQQSAGSIFYDADDDDNDSSSTHSFRFDGGTLHGVLSPVGASFGPTVGATPTRGLTIDGDGYFTGGLDIRGGSPAATAAGMHMRITSVVNGVIEVAGSLFIDLDDDSNNTNDALFIRDNGTTTVMNFTAAGARIGDETPATEKLDVVGTTRTQELRITSPTVPASAGATGTTGDIAWDANYIYVCIATDTWKRVAIATW
jgi:hypothetical protein